MAEDLSMNTHSDPVSIDNFVSNSDAKAYVAMVHAYNDLPLQVREATYRGEKLATVFVVENDGELEAFATSGT